MRRETAFQMAASNVRFGRDVTGEVGMDLVDLGVKRTMVVIDPALVSLPVGQTVLESLRKEKIDFALFDRVAVEPTDTSFREAIQFASDGNFDSFVAVGGGSTIDTAKAANLYSTHPADFLDYVVGPIGRGLPIPGPLKPMIAIPTTAGTGSETTGVSVFDFAEKKSKAVIAHRYLKPTLGLIDADNTRTLPAAVAASTGSDVLSHALESYTAAPYTARPKPSRPLKRPAYQGANPISDIWALRALEIIDESLLRAVEDPSDDEARLQMLLAACIAGIGFGSAGVTLPHAMSYPISGMARDYRPDGYDVDCALVPHGTSVILSTPAVVRFTAPASPERHLKAAAALGVDISDARPEDAGEILAQRVIEFMRKLKLPNGLSAVGYTEADIPALVDGTLPQRRVTKLSPVRANREDLGELFKNSLTIW